jgi:hypothetical protein
MTMPAAAAMNRPRSRSAAPDHIGQAHGLWLPDKTRTGLSEVSRHRSKPERPLALTSRRGSGERKRITQPQIRLDSLASPAQYIVGWAPCAAFAKYHHSRATEAEIGFFLATLIRHLKRMRLHNTSYRHRQRSKMFCRKQLHPPLVYEQNIVLQSVPVHRPQATAQAPVRNCSALVQYRTSQSSVRLMRLASCGARSNTTKSPAEMAGLFGTARLSKLCRSLRQSRSCLQARRANLGQGSLSFFVPASPRRSSQSCKSLAIHSFASFSDLKPEISSKLPSGNSACTAQAPPFALRIWRTGIVMCASPFERNVAARRMFRGTG